MALPTTRRASLGIIRCLKISRLIPNGQYLIAQLTVKMHISSPSGSESGSQSRMAPETFRLDPIPNADLDTDSDPDADSSSFSCAGGEGHPFETVRAGRSFGFPSPRWEGRRYLPMRTTMRVCPRPFLNFTLQAIDLVPLVGKTPNDPFKDFSHLPQVMLQGCSSIRPAENV